MKRTISYLLVLALLLLSFTACNKSGGEGGEPDGDRLTGDIAEESTEAPTEEQTTEPPAVQEPEDLEDCDEDVFVDEALELRTLATESASAVKTLSVGTKLHRVGCGEEWSKVIYRGETYYCYTALLSKTVPDILPSTMPSPEHTERVLSTVDGILLADMRVAATTNNPVSFGQHVNDLMEGRTLKRIGIPVKKIEESSMDCTTKLYVVTKELPTTIVTTYTLVIPANTYSTVNVNAWVYFDLEITLEQGQTLAFGDKNESIYWGYANSNDAAVATANEEVRGCQINIDTVDYRMLAHSLAFDLLFEEETEESMEDPSNPLAGKYISILGASTSTFYGYVNSTLYQSEIVDNAVYYPKNEFMKNVNDTWWIKTIEALDLKLCVNNSWSGSCVTTYVDGAEKAACMDRATQLHNDRLNIEPDIIILMIGGNDALRGYDVGNYRGISQIYDESTGTYIGNCKLFAQAYATMVHKVKMRYPNADIYVCSMLNWQTQKHNRGVEQYNDAVERIAEDFGVHYIDLYNGTQISPATKDTYLHSDYVHPNAAGFAEMSDCVVRALRENYS